VSRLETSWLSPDAGAGADFGVESVVPDVSCGGGAGGGV